MAIEQTTTYKVKVNQTNGRLQTTAPISLRNVVKEGSEVLVTVNSLEDIKDVTAVQKVDGASVVYNSSASRYEIKEQDLDGGSF